MISGGIFIDEESRGRRRLQVKGVTRHCFRTGRSGRGGAVSMSNHLGWNALLLAFTLLSGCETVTVSNSDRARILTGSEMDQVSAGAAVAFSDAAAHALGPKAQTSVSANAQTNSSNSLIAEASLRNYAAAGASASASSSGRVQADVSSQISVNGASGGARINAAAVGTAGENKPSLAQASTQTYGISTSRTDLAFGSVSATACCGPAATAQVKADSAAGGPYSTELRSTAMSDIAGQVQSRVDVAVVSSRLPILDPAQLLVTGGPARISPKY